MHNTLGAHIIRTPGHDVPAAFPDVLATEKTYGDAANEETLLESAKAYLPMQEDIACMLSNAKAYLPQGVAAYFPGTNSTSTSAPTPQSVDVGHGASVPYTESVPEPYSECLPSPRSTTNSSTAVDVGHGTSVPYTTSAPMPHAPVVPHPTRDESTTMHTGHSTSAIPPATLRTTSGLLPLHPVAAIGTPPLMQSPGALPPPQASTDLVLAAQISLPPSYALSTPLLTSGGASGYTTSSESRLVQMPVSMSTEPSTNSYVPTSFSLHFSLHFSLQSQSEGPRAPQNSVATLSAAVTGSVVLNSCEDVGVAPMRRTLCSVVLRAGSDGRSSRRPWNVLLIIRGMNQNNRDNEAERWDELSGRVSGDVEMSVNGDVDVVLGRAGED
ncbi:hypothetical protein B0H17DRAFT_1209356 [Mycena rosella]|uniref:Uncharacterized protein n=1 Tax=Mycena rosella TaxID=1033263 RepID=A0AAD7CYW8_MYCRO|nr:hypothetical protein B0H17DRAFT_1209356 [Mycena rosella]